MRWWLFNQLKVKKTNLLTIPPASTIFRDAEAAILPDGMTVDRDTMCATVPLQSLLDKTVTRYLFPFYVCLLFIKACRLKQNNDEKFSFSIF